MGEDGILVLERRFEMVVSSFVGFGFYFFGGFFDWIIGGTRIGLGWLRIAFVFSGRFSYMRFVWSDRFVYIFGASGLISFLG